MTSPGTWQPTACILCECNCGIDVLLGEDGRTFSKIRGDKLHPASQGYTCNKALRLDYYQNGRVGRLTSPLRRTAAGDFEEIDWDTAIAEIAARLADVRAAHGGETIFYYGGGGQGNHLGGAHSTATKAAYGAGYRSSTGPGEDGRILGQCPDARALHPRRLRALRGGAVPGQESVPISRLPTRASGPEGDRQGSHPLDDRCRSGAHRER